MIIDISGNRLLGSGTRKISLIDMLKQHMDEYDISQKGLADILSINLNSLRNIFDGSTTEIKLNHAIKIANLVGVSESELIDVCAIDFSEEEISNINRTKKIAFILNNFDLESLKSLKLIKSIKNYDEIEDRICTFFGFKSIFEYNRLIVGRNLYSKSKQSVAEKKRLKMLDFWVRCNKYTFETINNPNDFEPEILADYMSRIKFFSKNVEKGFYTVVKALYKIGVTVIVQSYMTRTTVFGSTMIVNGKPCIVLTNMRKKYDKLWFTLIHELYHVVMDFTYLEKVSYHITDSESPDLFVSEDSADEFASELLFGEEKLKIVRPFIYNHFKIELAAQKANIHYSIIYGQFLHSLNKTQQKDGYKKFSKFLIGSEPAIKYLLYNPLEHEKIIEAVTQIKETYRKIS